MDCLPRICLRGKVFIGPIPINGCPIVESITLGLFTEPLPNNGYMRHNNNDNNNNNNNNSNNNNNNNNNNILITM
jgi:hypothetical protein